jgi:hypothetical protein
VSMDTHATRDHATWSASATARLWACPGSLPLTKDLPEEESEAAAWGTACHEVAEECFATGKDASAFIGRVVATKKFTIDVDDEVAETAQVYVDYVRNLGKFPTDVFIEKRFSFEALNTPFDAGGTCDAIAYSRSNKELEVVDLKGGRGVVVEAFGNHQLRTYALGAMLHVGSDYEVKTIKVTIVQPRAPHKDGRIRSETFTTADLMDWTWDLLAAMHRAEDALRSFEPTSNLWATNFLSPGDHCTFCKAKPFCPALEKKVTSLFDDLSDDIGHNGIDKLMPEDIAARLDQLDLVESYIKAFWAYAKQQAEMGVNIPGWMLVDKQARPKWREGVSLTGALRDVVADTQDLYETKMRSPAQVRGVITESLVEAGKHKTKKAAEQEARAILDDLTVAESSGTNLVRVDKTTRPPAAAKSSLFDILD